MRCCFHSFKDLYWLSAYRFFRTDCKGKSLYEFTKNFLLLFNPKLFTKQRSVNCEFSVIFRADGKDTISIVTNKFFRPFHFLRF
jgi:hypothetical protein